MKRIPFIVAGIIFVLTLVPSLIFFGAKGPCANIIGDGYMMGIDPEPVVIGQSCATWGFAEEFWPHTLIAALIATPIAIFAGAIVWIAFWREKTIGKRIGALFLLPFFTIISFLGTSFIGAMLLGGIIDLTAMAGKVVALVSVILAEGIAITFLYLLFKRKKR
ncbi:MAG: hypothetical protein WAQ27_03680 [Candidatus Microsaccharimonas sp.]